MQKLINKFKNFEKMRARGVSFLDQAMFSAGNFVLTIILARYFSDIEVAGYGVGLSVGLILQNILWTMYVIKNSVMPQQKFVKRADKIMGQHLIIMGGILTVELIGVLTFALHWPSEWSMAISWSIVVCTLIYLQLDFERIFCLKHQKTNALFWSSFLFLSINMVLFFAVPRYDIGYQTVMLIIVLFSLFKILHLITLIKKPDFKWGWTLTKGDISKNSTSSILGASGGFGYIHLPVFLMSKFAAPLESAAFIALRGLVQPAMIVIRSLDVIDKNHFNPKSNANVDVRHAFLKQIPLYLALAFMTMATATLLGKPVLNFFYGDRFDAFYPLVLGWAMLISVLMLLPPIDTIVVKKGRIRQHNYFRLGAGVVGGVLAILLCPIYGAKGAILIPILGNIVILSGGLWVIRDVLFSKREAPKITQQ